jgi:hypothetical protein
MPDWWLQADAASLPPPPSLGGDVSGATAPGDVGEAADG